MLRLPIPPSVNACYGTDFRTKRRFKSVAYKNWEKLAGQWMQVQRKYHFIGKVNVTPVFGRFNDKRTRDVHNYEKALYDFLETMGIVENDSLIQRCDSQWSKYVEPKEILIKVERYEKDLPLAEVFGKDAAIPPSLKLG